VFDNREKQTTETIASTAMAITQTSHFPANMGYTLQCLLLRTGSVLVCCSMSYFFFSVQSRWPVSTASSSMELSVLSLSARFRAFRAPRMSLGVPAQKAGSHHTQYSSFRDSALSETGIAGHKSMCNIFFILVSSAAGHARGFYAPCGFYAMA
jgi:hypothetical protein